MGRLQGVLQLRDGLAHVGGVSLGGEQIANLVDDVHASHPAALQVEKHRGPDAGQQGHAGQGLERPVPAVVDAQTGHASAGQDSTKIPDAVDQSTGRRASLLSAQVERDGAGQIRVRTEHQKSDQSNQPHRRQRAGRKIGAAQNPQHHGRQQAADQDHQGPAARPQPIAQPAGHQHRRTAQQRKQRALIGGLGARRADGFGKIGRRPDAERLAQQRQSQRQQTHDQELRIRDQRNQKDWPAWRGASSLPASPYTFNGLGGGSLWPIARGDSFSHSQSSTKKTNNPDAATT